MIYILSAIKTIREIINETIYSFTVELNSKLSNSFDWSETSDMGLMLGGGQEAGQAERVRE